MLPFASSSRDTFLNPTAAGLPVSKNQIENKQLLFTISWLINPTKDKCQVHKIPIKTHIFIHALFFEPSRLTHVHTAKYYFGLLQFKALLF